MSTTDMQEEIAELELILRQVSTPLCCSSSPEADADCMPTSYRSDSERLATHNAARTAKGMPEQQPKQIVAEYTQLLNQYNNVKDAAQLIFDKIAEIEQLPAQDIFARYGVGEGET
ncbi:hypothetical protein NDA16_000876 [Ustilago loliicola]|nr:hypothetical protein NDA16_000876 [Ustilago loliicola]